MYNGKVIRRLLKERGILQKELLEYLYPDLQKRNGSIVQIENGNPTVKTLERIADFFQVSMDVFFERSIYANPTKKAIDNDLKNQLEALQTLADEKERFIQYLIKQQDKTNSAGANSGQLGSR